MKPRKISSKISENTLSNSLLIFFVRFDINVLTPLARVGSTMAFVMLDFGIGNFDWTR